MAFTADRSALRVAGRIADKFKRHLRIFLMRAAHVALRFCSLRFGVCGRRLVMLFTLNSY